MTLHRTRRAKIVATLGPASAEPDTIARLFDAGADVFRLNFSHGEPADHAARVAVLRELEARSGRPIGILADLQGPKLRVGRFEAGAVTLEPGQSFRLDLDPAPGDGRHTSLRAARERPHAPILSLTPSRAAARRLTLAWGVHSVHLDEVPQASEMTELARERARREGLAHPGDPLVMIADLPFGESGSTNLLHITVA